MPNRKENSAKKLIHDKVMYYSRGHLAILLSSLDYIPHSSAVAIDEGPIEKPDILEDLKEGRIEYIRSHPPIERLKYVWSIKGHLPPDKDRVVELLIGKFTWVEHYYLLAYSRGGEWSWVGG